MSNPPPSTNTSPEASRIWHRRPLLLPLMFITGIALIMLGILNMDTLAQEEKETSDGQTCQQYVVNSVTTCVNAPYGTLAPDETPIPIFNDGFD